ncbi:hypothetical protein BPNPMPFG_002529 [Mesorhizobium sp. AR07]|uniref:phage tail tube protein n=1 Tax=Mesorhizobium sp. AR07 TaxID=2865838 RepID=UPI0021600868|nr:hypothetical protein [Mesorhizobium sp. AR07]UVK46819.1 hypothetical protein BPNPMPFG_002529 [Mesorhizobium sp. AR07]
MDFQSNNLTVPRGKGYFARYLPGTTTPGPFRELGNCPDFTLTRNATTLPHYGSQSGMRKLDAEPVIDATLTGAITTDDMKTENAAFWFMGDVATISATAQTALTETRLLAKAGDMYQLGRSDANPTGNRKLTNVVVTDGAAGSPATLVLGVAYEVDLALGLLTILTDLAKFVVTYDTAISTRQQIAATVSQIEGELKFISFNALGVQSDVTIPRARLAPNGDLSLLTGADSPAYQTMGLSITALYKGNLALAYRDGRPA